MIQKAVNDPTVDFYVAAPYWYVAIVQKAIP